MGHEGEGLRRQPRYLPAVDSFEDACDVAVVISDDSDLLEPVRVVRERLGKRVGVVRIRTDRGSVFRNRVDFVMQARTWHFTQAQLPMKCSCRGDASLHVRRNGPMLCRARKASR
jgi:hypothetical protein